MNEGAGRIIAFEPGLMNARFFRRHMRLNLFNNVVLYEASVGEYDGEVLFDTACGSATGMVSATGDLAVKQVSVAKLVY